MNLKKGLIIAILLMTVTATIYIRLGIALDFLNQQKQSPVRTVILSDILQSGIEPKKLYTEVASLLKQKNIDKFIGIGPDIFSQKNEFSL